jgi:hypothetical protein
MALKQAPVATTRRRAQLRRRSPPPVHPLLEGDASQLKVDPFTPTHVVLDVGEEGARISLSIEGLAARPAGFVPIAGTPASIALVDGAAVRSSSA